MYSLFLSTARSDLYLLWLTKTRPQRNDRNCCLPSRRRPARLKCYSTGQLSTMPISPSQKLLLPASLRIVSPVEVVIDDDADAYYADILNTLNVAFPEATRPEFAKDYAISRHLSKHIWKSQYDITVNVKSYSAQREAVDMAIMARGPVSTPSRLVPVLPILQQMYRNHRAISYQKLRDKLCPSTVGYFLHYRCTGPDHAHSSTRRYYPRKRSRCY
jgi:hypothetical protein